MKVLDRYEIPEPREPGLNPRPPPAPAPASARWAP
jgi:hypothetical protein